jgi:hypothetical protein
MKIKIAKKESPKEEGKPTTLYDDKGVRFSGFLPGLKDLNIGDVLDAQIKMARLTIIENYGG